MGRVRMAVVESDVINVTNISAARLQVASAPAGLLPRRVSLPHEALALAFTVAVALYNTKLFRANQGHCLPPFNQQPQHLFRGGRPVLPVFRGQSHHVRAPRTGPSSTQASRSTYANLR